MCFRPKVGGPNCFLIFCREPQEQPVNHLELQKHQSCIPGIFSRSIFPAGLTPQREMLRKEHFLPPNIKKT
jgi:hypothetical protein